MLKNEGKGFRPLFGDVMAGIRPVDEALRDDIQQLRQEIAVMKQQIADLRQATSNLGPNLNNRW